MYILKLSIYPSITFGRHLKVIKVHRRCDNNVYRIAKTLIKQDKNIQIKILLLNKLPRQIHQQIVFLQ